MSLSKEYNTRSDKLQTKILELDGKNKDDMKIVRKDVSRIKGEMRSLQDQIKDIDNDVQYIKGALLDGFKQLGKELKVQSNELKYQKKA